MPRASDTALHCKGTNDGKTCGKLLGYGDKQSTRIEIKCPRCHTVNEWNLFAETLTPGEIFVCFLWTPDGTCGSSIVIQKQIWLNVGRFPVVPAEQSQHAVFHLFNHLDRKKAFSPDSGGRVNDSRNPFLRFEDAWALGERMMNEALASGEWVHVDQLKGKGM